MKYIDITFDFETCSTAPDAAPMQLGAIAWNRHSKDEHPFLLDDTFNVGIDLRTCVTNGFSFDQSTVNWWNKQSELAKINVLAEDAMPVDTAYLMFCKWIVSTLKKYNAENVCLWCQGQDFDFPILKTITRKFGLQMPIHQHYFRDCRTFILESVMLMIETGNVPKDFCFRVSDIMSQPMLAYNMIPKLSASIMDGRTKHDALYDCLRSTWCVWQCMKMLKSKK